MEQTNYFYDTLSATICFNLFDFLRCRLVQLVVSSVTKLHNKIAMVGERDARSVDLCCISVSYSEDYVNFLTATFDHQLT